MKNNLCILYKIGIIFSYAQSFSDFAYEITLNMSYCSEKTKRMKYILVCISFSFRDLKIWIMLNQYN